ncbi:MAG: ABC transporter ATP-binding protein [DPANN group archaeon]|nr:ABC transporter ATP-binding protein [DPANN group archaeon]
MITTEHLTKQFGNLKAIDSISIEIKKGEIFGFLGPNGAGKTTTINILTGQMKATDGIAKILGIDVNKHPVKVRENIGIVPEQENPPSFLTPVEYLEFISKIRHLKENKKDIDFWFDFLEFNEHKNTLCKDLSRGTKQKLMIAQAFIHNPQLVFIDEPLINLDPMIQKKIKTYIINYAKKGNSIFISTHVLEIAQELCDKICIINRGKIIACDSLKNLTKESKGNLETAFISLVEKNK